MGCAEDLAPARRLFEQALPARVRGAAQHQ